MNQQIPTPATEADLNTKESILVAAERLFAEHGVPRASLRAITSEARVNLAAVHYHFGSKEGLVQAVFSRRLEPLQRRRFELLDQAEGFEGELQVEDIVRAFIRPSLEMVEREPGGHAFARFLLGTFQDPNTEVRGLLIEQFQETIERFVGALGRALPHLSREELFWRFHFMVGTMAHTVALGSVVQRTSQGICDPHDIDAVVGRLVQFISGGMRSGLQEAPR